MKWPHEINLEVFIQDPTSHFFRLDVTPLDFGRLYHVESVEFILDESKLGVATLGAATPAPDWWDITAQCTHISSLVGARPDKAVPSSETGTLEATLINQPGVMGIGINPGTPLRLRRNSTPLWIGAIDDVTVTWEKSGDSSTVITASDWVSQASKTTRYGRQIDNEPAINRFTALINQSLQVQVDIKVYNILNQITALRECCAIVDESSLADHLTWAATTGAFMWGSTPGLERPGVIIREFGAETKSYITLFDTHAPSFTAATVSSGTSQIINEIEINQHFISYENNEPSAATTTSKWRNTSSIYNWGLRSARADVTLANPVYAKFIAEEIMSRATESGDSISSLTIRGEDWINQDIIMQPLKSVDVVLRGRIYKLIVATVSHDITPDNWTVTLSTIRRTK